LAVHAEDDLLRRVRRYGEILGRQVSDVEVRLVGQGGVHVLNHRRVRDRRRNDHHAVDVTRARVIIAERYRAGQIQTQHLAGQRLVGELQVVGGEVLR
jgi:hypothetical protein